MKRGPLAWLFGGDDHQLAAELANRARRKDAERAARDSARTAARKGQQWEDAEWRRLGGH